MASTRASRPDVNHITKVGGHDLVNYLYHRLKSRAQDHREPHQQRRETTEIRRTTEEMQTVGLSYLLLYPKE